jgi:hypothetical protein
MVAEILRLSAPSRLRKNLSQLCCNAEAGFRLIPKVRLLQGVAMATDRFVFARSVGQGVEVI